MKQRVTGRGGGALRSIREADGRLSPRRLLIIAAIFHLAVTAAVFGLGWFGVLPGMFNRAGLAASFAPDAVEFRDGAAEMSGLLARGEFAGWITAHQPFHVKLYSISFAVFGPLLGKNVLAAEPLNVLYYLLILTLVFKLGREAFGRRTSLLAAAGVGLWPSLLLHTTQPLRDQLFIIGMLTFLLLTARWLTRTYGWRRALLSAAAGGLTAVLVWLARDNMAVIMLMAGFVAAGLFVVRRVAARRPLRPNLAGMALMFALAAGAMWVMPKYRPPEDDGGAYPNLIKQSVEGNLLERTAARVGLVRVRFVHTYPDAGSNIDDDVRLNSLRDIVRYSPRAAAIGYFAPFPGMWFTPGKQVGSAGRRLVGAESLLMYVVEVLAACGMWLGRRRLAAWLLFLVAAAGMFAVGLVVANVGALYRIRYLFVIMLTVLAAEAVARSLGRRLGEEVGAAAPGEPA